MTKFVHKSVKRKASKFFQNEPYVVNLAKLEILYDFILNFADTCHIEVVSISLKQKEVREFHSFADFLSMKDVIKNKIRKLRLRAYKENSLVIKLEFINPKGKIFPFLDSYTLKSYFYIQGEKAFESILEDYKEIIDSMISYQRRAYKTLHAFLTSFFAILFTTVYTLMLVRAGESSLVITSLSLVLFFLFSIAVNIFFNPFLYLHNPLVRFEFDIKYENYKGMYFKVLANFIRSNIKSILFSLLSAVAVYFFGFLFKFLLALQVM